MKFRALLAALPCCSSTACGGGDATPETSPRRRAARVKPPRRDRLGRNRGQNPRGRFPHGQSRTRRSRSWNMARAPARCAAHSVEPKGSSRSRAIISRPARSATNSANIRSTARSMCAPICSASAPATATFFPILDQMFKNQELARGRTSGSPAGQAMFQRMQNAKPAEVAIAFGEGLGYMNFMKQRGLPENKARACLAIRARISGSSKG